MSQNIQRDLEAALVSGSSYEALQLLKSLLFRSSGSLDATACDLFKRGLKQFVEDGNAGCALDLCKAFVESLSRRKDSQQHQRVGIHAVEAIKCSIGYMKSFPSDRSEYVKMLLKWAADRRPLNDDDKELDVHQLVGEQFLGEGDNAQAFYHLVRSNDAEACAACVLNLQNAFGYPSEFDLFAAQVILQLLVLKHVEMANKVYTIIVCSDRADKLSSRRSSVMFNFLDLLIDICRRQPRSGKNFELVVKGYARVYDWDPVLDDYVKLIGQHLFGIAGRADSSGTSGFLAEAMRNLLLSSPMQQPEQNGDGPSPGNECGDPT